MVECRENFSKETANMKKYQTEMTEFKVYIIAELKNTWAGFNSRLDEAQDGSVIWNSGLWNSPK